MPDHAAGRVRGAGVLAARSAVSRAVAQDRCPNRPSASGGGRGGFLSPADKQIDSHGGHFVERALSVARRFGIEHERLDEVGLAQRFPQFKVSGPMLGYYERTGGFVRPEACVEAQLLLARRGGAATEFG